MRRPSLFAVEATLLGVLLAASLLLGLLGAVRYWTGG